jgi:hypothetical protein
MATALPLAAATGVEAVAAAVVGVVAGVVAAAATTVVVVAAAAAPEEALTCVVATGGADESLELSLEHAAKAGTSRARRTSRRFIGHGSEHPVDRIGTFLGPSPRAVGNDRSVTFGQHL